MIKTEIFGSHGNHGKYNWQRYMLDGIRDAMKEYATSQTSIKEFIDDDQLNMFVTMTGNNGKRYRIRITEVK
jgi:hypothetical protein